MESASPMNSIMPKAYHNCQLSIINFQLSKQEARQPRDVKDAVPYEGE